MKFIFDIIKGIIIGIANIIPGVSGGTMAVTMGVYDKILESINNLIKDFKKSFLTLLPLGIGMVAGIGVFSFILPYCLSNYSFQTSMCFIGLIVGGIPSLFMCLQDSFDKEKRTAINPLHIMSFLIFLGVAIFMALANPTGTSADTIQISPLMVLLLLLLGIVCAAAMVIPGVSGSLLLMMLGYYSGIMSTISNFLSAVKDLNGEAILRCVVILAPFGIGCVMGVILISKLIAWLLKKFESITYCGIFGLIAASPFAILCKMENPQYTPISVTVGIVLFIVGFAFTYLFEKFTSKMNTNKDS